MTSSWQDYLRERELERQIAAGETPGDVIVMLAYAIAVWILVLSYVVWGRG